MAPRSKTVVCACGAVRDHPDEHGLSVGCRSQRQLVSFISSLGLWKRPLFLLLFCLLEFLGTGEHVSQTPVSPGALLILALLFILRPGFQF